MKANHKQITPRYDVAILGYGPTGATLAHLLSLHGLNVLVLDKEKEMYPLPRAVHFDDETMRIFQTIGIANQLCKMLHINPGMKFVNKQGRLLLDWPRPQVLSSQGWNASYRFHQPDLERILRGSLQAKPNVTILTGCQVTDVSQSSENVIVHFIDKDNDQAQVITAEYVVGCDGANSIVRKQFDSDLEDLGFRQKWLVVDLLLKEDMPQLGDHSVQFCDPKRPMTYCRNPKNRRRWEIATIEGETDEDILKPERIWNLLSKWITPLQADIERKAIYTFRSVIAKRWVYGRLLIAGDAAHLTPPFMGQGMCAGVRDAANLAWKLALCVKNHVGHEILQSYEQERIPHVKAYISKAVILGELIYSEDPLSMLSAVNDEGTGQAKMKSISPLLGDADFFSSFAPFSKFRGQLLGQPVFRNGLRMDDLYGYRAVLISRNQLEFDKSAVLAPEFENSILLLLDKLDTYAVLLRPDHYILATAKDANETKELCDLVSHTFGDGFVKQSLVYFGQAQ